MTFSSLGLSPALIRSTEELGFGAPTPVQAAAIPPILEGRDVWASAMTGSGKTAAFALPLLERLSAAPAPSRRLPRALVVVPTRELAAQVAEVVEGLGWHQTPPLRVCVVVGGVSINPQMMELRSDVDIVVGTPGRLLDLVEQKALRLGGIEMLVLDEADRLLSAGFADELARLTALLPAQRQSLLFSATFPPAVQQLASTLLVDPVALNVDAGAAPDASLIAQRAIEVDAGSRTMLLRHLLTTEAWTHVLVFVGSQHAAEHVTGKLVKAGIGTAALHGDLSQGTRSKALQDFKERRLRVLVATDLAARGVDIAQLPAVVNYDLPRSPSDYVHRIGRTGRASDSGVAISFLTAESSAHFALIERRNRLAIPREQVPGFEPRQEAVSPRDPNGGIKGKRKSKKDKLREAAAAATGKPPEGS
jgi:ATP-dependent RNA helicase RhlE